VLATNLCNGWDVEKSRLMAMIPSAALTFKQHFLPNVRVATYGRWEVVTSSIASCELAGWKIQGCVISISWTAIYKSSIWLDSPVHDVAFMGASVATHNVMTMMIKPPIPNKPGGLRRTESTHE